MPDSATVILRDLTTGAGRTGLTVKLRRKDDNFATDYKTGTEVIGKAGVYEFTDVPFNVYKLWVNNSEDNSFGGANGRPWPITSALFTAIDLFVASKPYINSNSVLYSNYNHAEFYPTTLVFKKYLEDLYLKLAGGTLTGALNLGGNKINNLDDPDDNQDAATKAFVLANSTVSSNHLIVDSNLSADTIGKKYRTIQSAINYAATQSPSASNQWLILIFDKKDTAGYVEDITLQPYIHLSGVGKTVRIYGTMGGMNTNTRFYNIQWTQLGNFGVSNIRAKNCSFITDDPEATGFDLTITGTTLRDCYLQASQNVLSGGNNNYMDLKVSKGFTPLSTDKGNLFNYELTNFTNNLFDI